jgi:hypothetical protein
MPSTVHCCAGLDQQYNMPRLNRWSCVQGRSAAVIQNVPLQALHCEKSVKHSRSAKSGKEVQAAWECHNPSNTQVGSPRIQWTATPATAEIHSKNVSAPCTVCATCIVCMVIAPCTCSTCLIVFLCRPNPAAANYHPLRFALAFEHAL